MITVNDKQFEIIENFKEALNLENLENSMTEYFDEYDYIVGDWAYGKLRLKGFNDNTNKNFNAINDSALIKSYIKEYCAYGCKYFVIKRIKVD